jgi:hypothetical protein
MSNGLVLSFLRRTTNSTDWNQQELAEFYRVEGALLQGGLSVATDRGISDEGDPWFVFCRADNEEVIAHFARIDREYVIVSNLHSGIARGTDFRRLIRQMIDSHPLMLPIRRNQNQKVFLHPAALLTAMLASAYFLSKEKEATSGDGLSDSAKNASTNSSLTQKFGILAAASLAAIWIEHQADLVFKFVENTLLDNAPSDHKAIQAAEIAHDFASLDTAIMQGLRDVESGMHRIDLSNSNLVATKEGNDHDGAATALITQAASTFVNGADHNNANSAIVFNSLANNDHVAAAQSDPPPSDNDSVVALSNLQPVMPAKDVAPAIPSSNQLTPSLQPSAWNGEIVATSEAVVQLALSDIVSPSIRPIVLANGPVPLSLALEQVSAQVGFGSSLPQNSTASASESIQPASTEPTSTPPAISASPSIGQIIRTVEAFLHNTPSYEIAVSGSNFMIVDTKVSDAASPDFGVLTWDLNNGSTLSIVGIIPHHHAPATA